MLYEAADRRQLHLTPLLREELVILLPPSATAPAKVTLDALTEMPLILPSGSHGLRRMIEQHLQDRGLTADPAIEVDSYSCIKQLVQDGFGCSILPVHAVAEESRNGLIQALPFTDRRIWREASLARHRTRISSRAASVAGQALQHVTAGLIADEIWLGASDNAGDDGT